MNIGIKTEISAFCNSKETGDFLFELMATTLKSGEDVILDFEGVNLSGLFLNTAIGRLAGTFPQAELEKRIYVVNLDETDHRIFNHTMKRMARYHSDPVYRETVDRVMLETEQTGT